MSRFQRTVEWFICKRCGTEVHGDGYTNHCTECFTSLHVDINPGDRASNCQGLMSVKDIVLEHGDWIILHHCDKCGFERKNKVQSGDNHGKLIALKKKLVEQSIHGVQ